MLDVGYHHPHKDHFEDVSFKFKVGDTIRLQYFGTEKKFIVSKNDIDRYNLIGNLGMCFAILLLRIMQS
jgi:hypothetical protein